LCGYRRTPPRWFRSTVRPRLDHPRVATFLDSVERTGRDVAHRSRCRRTAGEPGATCPPESADTRTTSGAVDRRRRLRPGRRPPQSDGTRVRGPPTFTVSTFRESFSILWVSDRDGFRTARPMRRSRRRDGPRRDSPEAARCRRFRTPPALLIQSRLRSYGDDHRAVPD